jgi:hypothetical protein
VIKDRVAVIVLNNKEAKNWLQTSIRLHVQNLQEWQGGGSMMC